MDCKLIQDELLAYHFATASDETRDAIDVHILDCGECLRAYLRLKRSVERGAAIDARPSEATRARVMADVHAALKPERATRVRAWLARPVPRYQGLAAAAVAVAIAMAIPLVLRSVEPPPAQEASTERIDTSRPLAESLNVF